ncbi:MAG: polysaccharide deacetylase family protein [Eubacteriales bacterium]
MMKAVKLTRFIGCFLLIFMFVLPVSASECIGWYCKRNKEHKQPVLDGKLNMAENYDVYWCDKKHKSMDDDDKVIYLTFDAGYENGNVEKILDTLKEEDVKGAFFILDNMIYKNKSLVKRMTDEGHTVGNHTCKHKDMTKMKCKDDFARELYSLEELYEKNFGMKMQKYYRPPEGKLNEENLIWAKELGYKTVMWSFAYADWDNGRQPSAENAMRKILDNVHNGEVMLLHPTSSTNAEILKPLIRELKSQGFRFGTLDELCEK